MLRCLISFCCTCLLFILTSPVKSQDIEDFVSKYTSENGVGYLQPFGNAVAANFNSGLFHSAHIPKTGITVDIGLTTMTSIIRKSNKTFTATTDDFFVPETTMEVPTIFGDPDVVTVEGVGGTAYTFPGGMDLNMLPLAVPQLRVGAVMGTDVTLRFFAADLGEDLGRLNLLGLGFRHSIDQYLPELFPVDLAAGYYWQSLKIDNFTDLNTSFFSLQGSYKAGPVIFYSGLGYELATVNFEYIHEEATIAIELDNTNSLRFNLGLALKLGPFYLNTDYNIGLENVLVLGLGIAFGE
ncbi:MAG: DUF6588 family protein [Candidatus Cyclobacteriaceae bacterium M3_2C_046]